MNRLNFLEGQVLVAVAAGPAVALLHLRLFLVAPGLPSFAGTCASSTVHQTVGALWRHGASGPLASVIDDLVWLRRLEHVIQIHCFRR